MSIKGYTQELYIGKTEANIINSKKQRYTIPYDILNKIEYRLADEENGKLLFITNESKKYSFMFSYSANDVVLRGIDYIKDKRPEVSVGVLSKEQNPNTEKKNNLKIKHQKCKSCGKEYDSKTDICPYCNYSNTDTHYKWLFIGGVVVACITIFSSSIQYFTFVKPAAEYVNDIYYTVDSQIEETASSKTLETESFSTTLTAGHYVIGIDMPSGTYSFFSKKGTGNLYSSDGTINAIFDHNNESGNSIGIDSFGTEELNNIYLEQDAILSVTGTQEISAGCSDGLISDMKKREQDNLKELEIGYGNYGASDDIPAGTYDIELIEGKGNIICQNNIDNGINEIMGQPESGNELDEKMYITKFKNFIINEGDILEISDIKIKLIPSK